MTRRVASRRGRTLDAWKGRVYQLLAGGGQLSGDLEAQFASLYTDELEPLLAAREQTRPAPSIDSNGVIHHDWPELAKAEAGVGHIYRGLSQLREGVDGWPMLDRGATALDIGLQAGGVVCYG